MSQDETIDIRQKLENLLCKIQPNLQDVIKRSFTNVELQNSKNGEKVKPDVLEDLSYFAKNTQVNLSRLELVKTPTFHIQQLSLDLQYMGLVLRCSLGEVGLKGIYSAYNENLYNLVPVMAEGHVLITLSNMTADVTVGLVVKDDAFSFINPTVDFLYDEVLVKLSWPSPQRNGGYDFVTTEQIAKHIDDLPLSCAVSLPLLSLLQRRLLRQLEAALAAAVSLSHLLPEPALLEDYSCKARELARLGNKVIDVLLMDVRRTLLQGRAEVVPLPPLHATFLHKVGPVSVVGKLETDTGWVKNLATVNRTCDVSVTRPDPTKTTFRVTLTVKHLQMGYDEYRIRTAGGGGGAGGGAGGRLAVEFADNALRLAVTVGMARWEPYAQLDYLALHTLDGAEVHVPGLGALAALCGRAGGWARGAAGAGGARALLATLDAHVRAALASLPLWDLAHPTNNAHGHNTH